MKFFLKLWKSQKKARSIVFDFRPDVAIGVGGFASGPLLRAAIRAKVPSLIQEQNSYAGITNKLLSKRVNRICVAYDKMDRFFPGNKIVLTGNPVRENLCNMAIDRNTACRFFNIDPSKQIILIIGGSLGAWSINHSVLKNIKLIEESDVQVIWQTGNLYYQRIMNDLKENVPENLHIHQFLTKMDYAYTAADLVISRAGAGTISELCVVGKPAILVPSPNVAEDHQTKNAASLAEKGAAVMIPDNEIAERLFREAYRLINEPHRLENISGECRKLSKPDATRLIVDQIEKLVNR